MFLAAIAWVVALHLLEIAHGVLDAPAFDVADLRPCSGQRLSVECTSASAWFLASTGGLVDLVSSASTPLLTNFSMSASDKPPDVDADLLSFVVALSLATR